MCGIAGIVGSSLLQPKLRARLTDMQVHLRHRGPDDEGLFLDSQGSAGLVHTRLAILDLSDSGHQPMVSDDERFTIVFNGEVYNFEELRTELEAAGESFHSRSDTEVVLRLYQRLGPSFVERLEGMFALAIWDNVERSCFLARDPFGIKPLYLWRNGKTVAFASEVRAVLKAKLDTAQLSADALREYLHYGSVQEPFTLVENITALQPGSWLLWKDGKERTEVFWQPEFETSPLNGSDLRMTVREALDESIQRHFVSDVPVNMFLSGGIDSTALLALSHKQGFDNVRSFCLSFDEEEFSEGSLAERTARHFGVDHHDFRMSASEGRLLVDDFLESLDQPSIDGFNTFCVSRFARKMGAKVVLSGLGGDELFGGYPSHRIVPRLHAWHRRLAFLPGASAVAGLAAQRVWPGTRGRRMSEFLCGAGEMEDAYRCMRGTFSSRNANGLVAKYTGARLHMERPDFSSRSLGSDPSPRNQVSVLEMTRYMRNQLLRDSDVMSMSQGLELRVPLVDRRLFETVSNVPAEQRMVSGKRMLLDAVPEVPDWTANRPKRGFHFPFQKWSSGKWGDVFQTIEAASPVSLDSWYQTWALFTLENFLDQTGISVEGRLLSSALQTQHAEIVPASQREAA